MFLMSASFVISVSLILIIIYSVTGYSSHSHPGEKISAFECGFDPLSKMRDPFSTRFFLLVVLFLIFDVEIALLFPVLSQLSETTTLTVFSGVGAFLMILLIGLFHEWNEGSLNWITN